MSGDELDTELARIEREKAVLSRHRESLEPPQVDDDGLDVDLLEQIRSRLDSGLTGGQRNEIVRLLVGRITITTTVDEDGTKEAKAMINYRLPAVVETRTVTRSWRR